eukprot:TRINITY_DN11123_c0_g1_i1.p1 TRINITY_DN11123_c0_g1~~TRINITY_DN11123_c0_g1_i1.p1  ORF type:complete len:329 (-),score=43.04 TRINITY_DN11123_c0_g1_i1:57-926(-)
MAPQNNNRQSFNAAKGASPKTSFNSGANSRMSTAPSFSAPSSQSNRLSTPADFNSKEKKVEARKSYMVSAPRGGTSGHVCSKCHSPLSGDYLSAMGRFWHKHCFVCRGCSSQLGDTQFYEDQASGDAFCSRCIGSKYRCSKCSRGILGPYVSFSDGRLMHPDCMSSTSCPRCYKPITGTQIEAMGKVWHPECFSCTRCRKALMGEFMKYENQPYCSGCIHIVQQERTPPSNAGNCYSCRRSITDGEYIVFGGNNSIHRGCFLCHKCNSSLDPSAFYNLNGKLTCNHCGA